MHPTLFVAGFARHGSRGAAGLHYAGCGGWGSGGGCYVPQHPKGRGPQRGRTHARARTAAARQGGAALVLWPRFPVPAHAVRYFSPNTAADVVRGRPRRNAMPRQQTTQCTRNNKTLVSSHRRCESRGYALQNKSRTNYSVLHCLPGGSGTPRQDKVCSPADRTASGTVHPVCAVRSNGAYSPGFSPVGGTAYTFNSSRTTVYYAGIKRVLRS